MSPRNTPQSFWTRVDKSGDCWLWMGSKVPDGYGKISWAGSDIGAHRIAYELSVGPIPEGLHLDHLCRVRHCVNPEHLEPVTVAENNRRAAAAQTHCRRGHAFDEATTYWWMGTRRKCRICNRENQARYNAQKKAAARTESRAA